MNFNFEGSLLVSGGGDMSIIVWELTNFTILKKLAGHMKDVKCVKFNRNPDKKL